MPTEPEKKDPVVVIFDGQLGHTLDNALTLALLQSLHTTEPQQADFSATSLTRANLQGAQFTDAVARFYNSVYLRGYPKRFQRYRGFSVGLDNSDEPPASPALAAALSRKDAEGEPLYPHETHVFTDTADPVALIRNALTAEKPGACAIVLAGAANNLQGLLKLNGGIELIKKQVSQLVIAEDFSPGAAKLIPDWPTPVAMVEASSLRLSPADVQFPWAEEHPVTDTLAHIQDPLRTTPLAAALYAVNPGHPGFETTSDGGNRLVLANGESLLGEYKRILAAQPAAREVPEFLKRFLKEEEEEEQSATRQ